MSFVYFARGEETGLIKIGHSTTPRFRISQVGKQCGEPCELIFYVEGSYQDEHRFHLMFKRYRYRGKGRGVEWFREQGKLADFIRKRYDYMLEFYETAANVSFQMQVLERLCEHPKLSWDDCAAILGGKPFSASTLRRKYGN